MVVVSLGDHDSVGRVPALTVINDRAAFTDKEMSIWLNGLIHSQAHTVCLYSYVDTLYICKCQIIANKFTKKILLYINVSLYATHSHSLFAAHFKQATTDPKSRTGIVRDH